MKKNFPKILGVSLTTGVFLISSFPSFADTIKTGNSTAEVHVNTSIQGSSANESTSNIETHIEVTTNGETKVLDADGPGTYSLNSKSSNGETEVSVTKIPQNPQTTVTVKSSTKSAEGNDENESKEKQEKRSFISKFLESIQDFLQRIFNDL